MVFLKFKEPRINSYMPVIASAARQSFFVYQPLLDCRVKLIPLDYSQ